MGFTFGVLSAEDGERMVLDFMLGRLNLPAGRVGIAPFGAHGNGIQVYVSRPQPSLEEFLSPSIGTCRVKVPDPASPSRVEHGVSMQFHGRDIVVVFQVIGMA